MNLSHKNLPRRFHRFWCTNFAISQEKLGRIESTPFSTYLYSTGFRLNWLTNYFDLDHTTVQIQLTWCWEFLSYLFRLCIWIYPVYFEYFSRVQHCITRNAFHTELYDKISYKNPPLPKKIAYANPLTCPRIGTCHCGICTLSSLQPKTKLRLEDKWSDLSFIPVVVLRKMICPRFLQPMGCLPSQCPPFLPNE